MVVPDQLIEAKSQFRVLKDNHMMPVLELLQNIIWETYRCGFNDLLFDGQSETLKQTEMKLAFLKNY
jgi:hypothetical protein